MARTRAGLARTYGAFLGPGGLILFSVQGRQAHARLWRPRILSSLGSATPDGPSCRSAREADRSSGVLDSLPRAIGIAEIAPIPATEVVRQHLRIARDRTAHRRPAGGIH